MDAGTKLTRGETGLHWAAYGAHADIVKLLLERGAPVDTVDDGHGATPLGWALYEWGNLRPGERERRSYYETVALLVRAGSKVDPTWFAAESNRVEVAEKIQLDSRMVNALRGELPGTA